MGRGWRSGAKWAAFTAAVAGRSSSDKSAPQFHSIRRHSWGISSPSYPAARARPGLIHLLVLARLSRNFRCGLWGRSCTVSRPGQHRHLAGCPRRCLYSGSERSCVDVNSASASDRSHPFVDITPCALQSYRSWMPRTTVQRRVSWAHWARSSDSFLRRPLRLVTAISRRGLPAGRHRVVPLAQRCRQEPPPKLAPVLRSSWLTLQEAVVAPVPAPCPMDTPVRYCIDWPACPAVAGSGGMHCFGQGKVSLMDQSMARA
jgi:hypothetical protein